MAIKLSDLIITSDIDGTLLHAPAPIPERNIKAITHFTQKGGRFAIASGRAIESARQYVQQLPVNCPCIVFNGCGIYDYSSEKLLFTHFLAGSALEHVRIICKKFPEIGAIMLSERTMYSVSSPYFVEKFLGMENQPFVASAIGDIKEVLFKVIFAMEAETVFAVEQFANAQGWNDVSFVRSSTNYLEMLPLGCNKGTGLIHLTQVMGVSMEQIVSIGDYYNDFEMLKATGYPVTVEEAPDEIKRICKLVVGRCSDGAVADLIEHLEAIYPPA